jgi:hypothetical protein
MVSLSKVLERLANLQKENLGMLNKLHPDNKNQRKKPEPTIQELRRELGLK